MNRVKNLLLKSANILSLEPLKRWSPVEVIIPFHHLVSDSPVPYIEPLYGFKNTVQFEQDLDFLLQNFTPISLTDIIAGINNDRPLPSKSFLITFDDALKQVYEVAMPILLKKGVPAALFIVPNFLDNKHLFYDLKKGLILNRIEQHPPSNALLQKIGTVIQQPGLTTNSLIHFLRSINYLNQNLTEDLGKLLEIDFDNFLRTEKPFMTTAQVQTFIKKGFSVGAHSMDHPLYRLISLEEQIRQTEESLKWIADAFNLPYKAFAFTHVDTGVSSAFFDYIFNRSPIRPDIIFGNTTGKLEQHKRVLHRFIGENPALPIETMVKSIMGYSAANKLMGNQFVKRA